MDMSNGPHAIDPSDRDDMHEAILEILVATPNLHLRDIHEALADREDLSITYSEEWDDQREEIQKHAYTLHDMGLIDVQGRGNPWYPTPRGRRKVWEWQD